MRFRNFECFSRLNDAKKNQLLLFMLRCLLLLLLLNNSILFLFDFYKNLYKKKNLNIIEYFLFI